MSMEDGPQFIEPEGWRDRLAAEVYLYNRGYSIAESSGAVADALHRRHDIADHELLRKAAERQRMASMDIQSSARFTATVELHAFRHAFSPADLARGHGLRFVDIPVVKLPAGLPEDKREQQFLNLAFHYGQNDVQPVEGCRSVSVGDIIRYDGRRFVVRRAGFKKVPEGWVPPADEHGRLLDESDWGLIGG